MKPTKAFWLAGFVVLMMGFTLAQGPPQADAASQPPAPTHQDAPAPEPHPELKPLVEDIRTLLGNGKFQDALPKADELLQQAKAKSDKIGEAYALRFRAFALQEMRKTTPDQLPEVASVWASALALWREIGDGALQVEALLGQAYCVWRASPEQAQALVAEALRVARGEAKRPLAVATALHNAGVDWYGVGQLPVAETLWQQALAIFEQLAPNSLEMASTLNNLGSVAHDRGDLARAEQFISRRWRFTKNSPPTRWMWQARSTIWGVWLVIVATWRVRNSCINRRWRYEKNLPPTRWMWQARSTIWGMWLVDRGDLARAEQLYQQALAIYEKLAPNSLDVAGTLNNLGNVARNRGDLAACGSKRCTQQALHAQQSGHFGARASDLARASCSEATCPQLAGGGNHAPQSGECGLFSW
jgi:tetratricopeptide (TPR) repeat protein